LNGKKIVCDFPDNNKRHSMKYSSVLFILSIAVLVSAVKFRIRGGLQDPFVHKIDSESVFNAITKTNEFNSNFGPSTKFAIDNRNKDAPVIYFINSNLPGESQRYHYDFVSKYVPNVNMTLDEFNAKTYFAQEKAFYAGVLQSYHYHGKRILGFQFYPQDVMKEGTIVHAAKVVRAAVNLSEISLVFLATGNQQTYDTIQNEFKALGIEGLSLQDIIGDESYQALVLGETYGYLRLFPSDDSTNPKDIVILNVLPLYLSVVSGVITTQFQDPNSHVSLKSRERGTPDCYYKDAATDKNILSLVDKPVRMVVTPTKVEITVSTKEQVDEFHKPKAKDPRIMHYDGKTKEVLQYDDMCQRTESFVDAKVCVEKKTTYGAKAANLAFLAHPVALGRTTDAQSPSKELGYDLSPYGFGIPFSFYDDVLNHPDNKVLKEKIEKLQKDMNENKLEEKKDINAAVRIIKDMFLAATIPKENVEKIEKSIAELGKKFPQPIVKLKFRSSASAEDIEGFDGAGLYTSCSVKLNNTKTGKCKWEEGEDDISPKRVDCALLGVYASLYNARAVEERHFAAIQGGIAMAIAVVPAYDTTAKVAANSVVVTKIQEATQGDLAGMTIASQVANGLVTNPEPGTLAEITWGIQAIPDEPISFTTIRHAKPTPGKEALTSRVLSDKQLINTVKLVQRLEISYCCAKAGQETEECFQAPFLSTSDKKKSLDLEFKYLDNHQYVIKQIREFCG
jgi:hypothetical protein